MFNKEIYEQTEPGKAFLEHLEAQILKISQVSAKHGGTFVGLMHVPVFPKKTLETSLQFKGTFRTLSNT